jgi:CMP-N,N'-diacetyllegionaminic acid synthase
MNVLAVILARAGSIGLPGKHLLPLLGKPVISYTYEHARSARRITQTVVSSDCPEIRQLATARGLNAICRPANLATADASVQDVMLHALDTVESRSEFRADALVVLYGNVPVRGAQVIDAAIEKLVNTRCDSVRSFCPVGKWHPAWMSRLDGDRVAALQPGSIHRRQDLEPLYLHDGAVVVVSRASMLRGRETPNDPHAFFGVDRRSVETQSGETVEIDQLRDLYWAQAVLRDQENTVKLQAA